MSINTKLAAAAALTGLLTIGTSAGGAVGKDWPMWGGTPERNMVSDMTGLPDTWDVESGVNVRWVADLGSQSYGNPVVAAGKVFVGSNNEAHYDADMTADAGNLLAFSEETGEFLWQHLNAKLAAGRVHDWPYQGVCSSPLVQGDRL